MALIKCPECGKENVSDSAEACPHCGFGVKEYTKNKTIGKDIPNNHILEQNSTHKKSIAFNKKIVSIGFVGIIVLIIVVLFGTKIITYNNAVKYYEMEEWKMAIEKFEELGDFSDSEELLQKAKLELAAVDYELGVYAYNTGDFATSIYLLEEAKSLYPSYIGLDEQLKLTRFMNDLQGTWESTKINIQVEGFRARLKDYNCNSYADYCDISPYTDDDGYFVISVVGESGNRTWELKNEEGSSNPNNMYSSDWVGYASNMDGTGMYFHKKY